MTTKPQTTASASVSDYLSLMTEIQTTIDKNDKMFKQIQETNYPNAGQYTSDLINYKIDTQVTDLTKARQQIWDFLTKKYAENTKLRTYYFDEIRKIDEYLLDLNKQQQEIIDSVQEKNIKTNTATENIKTEKYNYNKMEYYLFLYKTLVIIEIIIIIIIVLAIFNLVPRATALVIIVIFLISTLAFVGYYVFFVNIGRNKFSWAKFEHDNGMKVANVKCPDKNAISENDKKKAAANDAVNELIKKSNGSSQSCSVSQ